MAAISLEPRDMEWVSKGVLAIHWSDGHKGIYPVRYLRQHCPCAACVDEWSGEHRLKPDDVPLLIMLQDIEPVGRYSVSNSNGVMDMIPAFTRIPCFEKYVSAMCASL